MSKPRARTLAEFVLLAFAALVKKDKSRFLIIKKPECVSEACGNLCVNFQLSFSVRPSRSNYSKRHAKERV